MIKNIAIAIGGLVVIAIVLGGWGVYQQQYGGQQVIDEQQGQDAEGTRLAGDAVPVPYMCNEGKTLGIIYDESYADVRFADGSSLGLIRGDVEGEEVVFGSADGSVQLFVRDYSAFIMEDGVETYKGCMVTDIQFPEVQ